MTGTFFRLGLCICSWAVGLLLVNRRPILVIDHVTKKHKKKRRKGIGNCNSEFCGHRLTHWGLHSHNHLEKCIDFFSHILHLINLSQP